MKLGRYILFDRWVTKELLSPQIMPMDRNGGGICNATRANRRSRLHSSFLVVERLETVSE